MKVKCNSCGKKFDPEKTDYMCPKCGSWHVDRESGEKWVDVRFEYTLHDEQQTQYGVGQFEPYTENNTQQTQYDDEHTESYTAGGMQDKESQDEDAKIRARLYGKYENYHSEWFKKKEKEHSKASKREDRMITAVIVIIFIMVAGIGAYSLLHSDGDSASAGRYGDFWTDDDESDEDIDDTDEYEGDNNFYVDSIPVRKYSFGREIVNQNTKEILTINSVKAVDTEEIDDAEAAVIPDGYTIYDMEYDLGRMTLEDRDGQSKFDVYLRTKSGQMLKPMSQKAVDEIMSDVDEYADEHGISEELDLDYSHLYFMVRSDDFDYMVVYSYDDSSDQDESGGNAADSDPVGAVSKIYLVGDKENTSEWIDVSSIDVSNNTLYEMYNGDYCQKFEPDKEYTLPGNAVITGEEICDQSGANLDEDRYDYYLVCVALMNHGVRNGTCNLISFDTGDDVQSEMFPVSYGDYSENVLTPMSVVYTYILYGMPKGQDENIKLSFEFGRNVDELQCTGGSIEVPK